MDARRQQIYRGTILTLIREGEIELQDCWHITEKDTFRKIRSGNIQEMSPLEQRDPCQRKHANN